MIKNKSLIKILFFFIFLLSFTHLIDAQNSNFSLFKHYLNDDHITSFSSGLPTFGQSSIAILDNPSLSKNTGGYTIFGSAGSININRNYSLATNISVDNNTLMGFAYHHYRISGTNFNTIYSSLTSSGIGPIFGASAKFMFQNKLAEYNSDKNIFAIDLNTGMLFNLYQRYYFNISIFNLVSPNLNLTDFKNSDIQFYPERSIKLGLYSILDASKSLTTFAEFRADSVHSLKSSSRKYSKLSLGLGLKKDITITTFSKISLLGGYLYNNRLDTTNLSSIKFSLSSNFPLASSYVNISYSGSMQLNSTIESSQNTNSHFITISTHLGSKKDITPPFAELYLDKSYISRNKETNHSDITFYIKANDNEGGLGLKKWALSISKKQERSNIVSPIRSFTGTGPPPTLIKWDGRSSDGSFLDIGTYYIQFYIIDHAHNRTATKMQFIEIRL